MPRPYEVIFRVECHKQQANAHSYTKLIDFYPARRADLFSIGVSTQERQQMPTIGETAPDFALPNQDGNTVRLSDFRGKKVVLFAYPKAGTSGCTTQACGFRDQFPKMEANGVVVLGISPDAPKDQKKWAVKEGLQYNLLCDTDHQVLEAWGAWGEKSMYGKKYMGVVRSHWVIDEHGVVIDEQLGVSATESVEKAVKSLGW